MPQSRLEKVEGMSLQFLEYNGMLIQYAIGGILLIFRRMLTAMLTVFFVLSGTGNAEYLGSAPKQEVYVVQSRAHTCTLIATTMMLRNYASRNGFCVDTITESSVRSSAWSSVGLSWDFTVESINVQVNQEIRHAENKKQYLIDALQRHPEGVVIYDAHAPHAIWLFGYDESNDTFYCADTTTDVAGRAIMLEESIIRGATQEDKIQTIDRIWHVAGIEATV